MPRTFAEGALLFSFGKKIFFRISNDFLQEGVEDRGQFDVKHKSSPGVNFINILCAAFTCEDPKVQKDTDNLTVFFVFLGSASIKAAHKMLM